RQQRVLIGAVVGEAMRDDDLRVGIDRGLPVIGLNEAVPPLHDPTLRISEVALRLGLWLAGRVSWWSAGPRSAATVRIARRRRPGGFCLPGFGLKLPLRCADARKPRLLVAHPIR